MSILSRIYQKDRPQYIINNKTGERMEFKSLVDTFIREFKKLFRNNIAKHGIAS